MQVIKGKYNEACAFARNVDAKALIQLETLCNQEFTAKQKIRVMPDAHAGVGCVVGTTMTISDKIVPNLVGVDIGCGMETVKLSPCEPDFSELDKVLRRRVPAGKGVRREPHPFSEQIDILDLTCSDQIFAEDKAKGPSRAMRSLGTLGGGNHFIELDRDQSNGDIYLIIHSGSRGIGNAVAIAHQQKAVSQKPEEIPPDLAWLEGEDFRAYLHDMKIMQHYADLNRKAIADVIITSMDWQAEESFTTIHNYIDLENMILRKGSISAYEGEKLLIPLNMRDGSLICTGLGNPDWNFSAPHGAGRAYSRSQAFKNLSLDEFKKEMEGIHSKSVNRTTLDESPMAYKPQEEIISQIGETVKIDKAIKPIYNFKAGA